MEEFNEPMIWDYPNSPEEEKGKYECCECGRQIYDGDWMIRDIFGETYCTECLANFKPEEVYDILNKKYDAEDLYKLLGGKWEEA